MSPKRNVRRAHVRTTFALPLDRAPEPLQGISWRAARLVAFANGVPALRRRLRAARESLRRRVAYGTFSSAAELG